MMSLAKAACPLNLHAPGCGRSTTHESSAGALGIPEFMPPNRRRAFKGTPMPRWGATINERGFPLKIQEMRRKREWKMPLCGPVFAQFSAGALNFQSKPSCARLRTLHQS